VDWARLKTIFIIAFLILDIFLLTQLLDKQRINQLEVKTDVSLEENLKNDEIDYSGIPKETFQDQYMSANTKMFTKVEVGKLPGQTIEVVEGTMIRSKLSEPVKIGKNMDTSQLDDFIQHNVLHGDQYVFGHYDETANTITYYQTYRNKPLFMNKSAHLVFKVNNSGEVGSYEQTMLENIEPISEKEEVLPAIQAVEAIYRKGLMKPGSKVAQAEMGYYTVVNMEASQVLTPTWNIVVEHGKEKEKLFVNAFEGQIIQVNPESDEKNIGVK
jgi:regulatory protein YycI of two-component signal transduction system YycFG